MKAGAVALALLPVPVWAADFATPQGCEPFLTVQSMGCAVALHWRCDVAPAGDHWEGVFDTEGLLSIAHYDGDYQWLETQYMWDGSREVTVGSDDPISLSDLLAGGMDTFAFTVRRTEGKTTEMQRVVGWDELMGETVTIDGVTLERTRTEHRYMTEDGDVAYHGRGQQYVSRDMRLFFLGQDEVMGDDGSVTTYDSTPVDFIHPGEPGFGKTQPLYGCDEIKTGYSDAG